MAKNPAGRPQSAIAFVAELEAAAGATYGPDWEERGRRHLAERAAALLPLLLRTAAARARLAPHTPRPGSAAAAGAGAAGRW